MIEWDVGAGEDGSRELVLRWLETGGPTVVKPSRQGFGSTVIERHAAAAFSGKVIIDFDESGLRWSLIAPLSAIENPLAHGDHA
ncbi:Blue-light-activated histidine kinase [compost metagenome]